MNGMPVKAICLRLNCTGEQWPNLPVMTGRNKGHVMKMGSSNDKEAVKAQYASPKGLDTRINFHNRYSTNKMGFSRWLISNYEIKEGMKVLELGTGTGDMWTGKDDLI